MLPAILILLAIGSAAIVAFGTQPIWASYGLHGLDVIIWSRRLQWPLVFSTVVICLALVVLIISNKRRTWWLLGLLPVLALFYDRTKNGPAAVMHCVQDLPMIQGALGTNDPVIGLMCDGHPCAIPYSTLSRYPVIIYPGREKSVIIFWSALANRALAFVASRDLRAADLEVISTPCNALLVYNSRLGEFINGLTGRTTRDQLPTGIHQAIEVAKCTWETWHLAHEDTLIMTGGIPPGAQSETQSPKFAMPGAQEKGLKRVCVVATTQPIAVDDDLVTDRPMNLMAGQTAILLLRVNGIIRAYNRELPADLVPRFSSTMDPKQKMAKWIDSDTNSQWSDDGHWVAGDIQLKKTSLAAIPADDQLDWNVMKFWYPDLHRMTDAELAAAVSQPVQPPDEKPAQIKHRKKPIH